MRWRNPLQIYVWYKWPFLILVGFVLFVPWALLQALSWSFLGVGYFLQIFPVIYDNIFGWIPKKMTKWAERQDVWDRILKEE